MKTITCSYAQKHWSRILREVEKGETITITRRGKPIATLSRVRDVGELIAEFKAYSKGQADERGPVTIEEIKEMINEGRR